MKGLYELRFKNKEHGFIYAILDFYDDIDQAIEVALTRAKTTGDTLLGVEAQWIQIKRTNNY